MRVVLISFLIFYFTPTILFLDHLLPLWLEWETFFLGEANLHHFSPTLSANKYSNIQQQFLQLLAMLGIGHRLEKETKKKILTEKAKEYNEKYDQLVAQGKEAQAAEILKKQQYQKRHEVTPIMEPYKTSSKINDLGGAVHLGYDRTTKTLTETQKLYQPMEEHMTKTKEGLKFDNAKAEKQQQQFIRMKKRIHMDHIAQDREINLQDPKQTDYSRNFVNDDKLKEEVRDRDKKYNQKMNDLKEYAEAYIKSKSSLRKC